MFNAMGARTLRDSIAQTLGTGYHHHLLKLTGQTETEPLDQGAPVTSQTRRMQWTKALLATERLKRINRKQCSCLTCSKDCPSGDQGNSSSKTGSEASLKWI